MAFRRGPGWGTLSGKTGGATQRMSGSRVARDKVDRALPCPVHMLCNPGSVSYPLCNFLLLPHSNGKSVSPFKDVGQKKKSHMLHPGNGRCRYGGENTSEHSMLVCGADSRCSEEGGLGPCS